MAPLPEVGATVSVLLDGDWLTGVVLEVSDVAGMYRMPNGDRCRRTGPDGCSVRMCTGEFLVDFHDDDEIEAWISAGEQWRNQDGLELGTETVLSDRPVIPALPPVPTKNVMPSSTTDAPTQSPPHFTAGGSAPQQQEVWHELVLQEFQQLHERSVKADGHGLEPASTTRARFERLHGSAVTVRQDA